jgi:rRNA maturation endonuclease Nob1
MSDEPTERRERSFARCTNCGTEAAALIDESGTITTPHGECHECGGDEFEEISEADLEELEVTDWTD